MNEFRWCLMYVVAFKAWLLGALEFSTVPTTHTQAPEVPVCGWWAKGKDDGALGTQKCVFLVFVYAMPAWMGTGHKKSCSAMPM